MVEHYWRFVLPMRFSLLLFLVFGLSACSQVEPPDFQAQSWRELSVRFCTDASALEVWTTRDKEKLELLQSALSLADFNPLDHVVRSHNHAIRIAIETEQGPQVWELVINRDQEHINLFNVQDPSQSYSAIGDEMFYRAVNTLLKSHMDESMNIFAKCEMASE